MVVPGLIHFQSLLDFLFIVTPIVGVCNCSMFCCTLLYVHSSIAIILMGKRELIALLNLSSWCLVMVERIFLAVPRGSLQFVIVVFPDHTPLLFSLSVLRRWFCCCWFIVFCCSHFFVCIWSLFFYCAGLNAVSSFAIISLGKGELVALL